MEVDVRPEQKREEAEYVLALCREADSPLRGAVIGGNPASEGFREYVGHYVGVSEVKGVRQVLHGGTPKGFCLTEAFVAGVRWLGEQGLRFDLCLRPTDLTDGAQLAATCPETRFVLDHCGNAPVQGEDLSEWKRGMDAAAAQPNVVGKVSGIVAGARQAWTVDDLSPAARFTIEVFGWERVMFGGDWPVCTRTASLRQWITALKEIVAEDSEENQRRLFFDNAVAFYEIAV
jgi:L-fuconolactonase